MRVRIMTSYPLQNTDFSSETIQCSANADDEQSTVHHNSSFAHIQRGRQESNDVIDNNSANYFDVFVCMCARSRISLAKSQIYRNICLKLFGCRQFCSFNVNSPVNISRAIGIISDNTMLILQQRNVWL